MEEAFEQSIFFVLIFCFYSQPQLTLDTSEVQTGQESRGLQTHEPMCISLFAKCYKIHPHAQLTRLLGHLLEDLTLITHLISSHSGPGGKEAQTCPGQLMLQLQQGRK